MDDEISFNLWISHKLRGEFLEDESKWTTIRRVDFEPQIEKPAIADLDPQTINDMKKAFYKTNTHYFSNLNADAAIKTISIVSFLGVFDSYFAVRMTSTLWDYETEPKSKALAGITWWQNDDPIIIFTYQ